MGPALPRSLAPFILEMWARPRWSSTELQDLLTRLARYFMANESQITAADVSNCLRQLADGELTTLKRLFVILYHCQPTELDLRHHQRRDDTHTSPRPLAEGGLHRIQLANGDRETRRLAADDLDTTWSSQPADPVAHPGHQLESAATPRLVTGHGQASPSPAPTSSTGRQSSDVFLLPWNPRAGGFRAQDTSRQLPAPGASCAKTATPPTDAICHAQPGVHLAAISQVQFAPDTEKLLRDCKLNPAEFFRSVQAAKVALPTGQGWEAAIATKKHNADSRDVLRVLHRFECYNIYRHVVEAGLHTGEHWIRESRLELVKTLCQKYPERFPNKKTTNKCLNWIDQGHKYHEWTKAFGVCSDLGYLIALPVDVPHSAYTSRCTKEQMATASAKLMELGINQLVMDLNLTNLGLFIAATLKNMTSKKRNRPQEQLDPISRKTLRMTLSAGSSTAPGSERIGTAFSEPVAAGSEDQAALLFGNNDSALVRTWMQDQHAPSTPFVNSVNSAMMDSFMTWNGNADVQLRQPQPERLFSELEYSPPAGGSTASYGRHGIASLDQVL